MNVLFLTLVEFESIQERNIYTDLLREFVKHDHEVFAISPVEKRKNIETHIVKEENATILRLQIGNTQKTNIIEKGISTLRIEPIIKKAINHYFPNIKFDLILYSTPPITFVGAIEYVKKRDGSKTYLLLKDIFPQNAVDIGLMSKTGLKGNIYRYFRKKEKNLYAISDCIGCMSQANVDYLLRNNPEIDKKNVEVCPNSVDVIDKSVNSDRRELIRKKYEIPLDKKIFVYGGNLGKPQGIPFMLECLEKCKDLEDIYFLIVGDGTEYGVLEEYIHNCNQRNIKLMKRIPKEDYDTMVGACDVGMIFLDYRFTIPNFPSRILSYMQAKIPVFACTDISSDIGQIIMEGGFGWWCKSNDADSVKKIIQDVILPGINNQGIMSFNYLNQKYSVSDSYRIIMSALGEIQ